MSTRPISPPPDTGPLKLKRTETFKDWLFLHYEQTDYVVRTRPDAILPKFWVQTVREEGPVFAASTLEECETWIEQKDF